MKRALKEIKSQINKAIGVRDPKKKPPLDKPAPEGAPNSDEAPYRAQILELVARIKSLLNDKSKDRSDEAMSVFRELVAVLRGVSRDRGEKPTDEEQSQRHVELQRCRLLWVQARKELHDRLQGVAAAVQKECQNEEEYDQADVKTKLKVGLIDALMNRLDTRLIDVLDQALNAEKPDKRSAFEKQAIQLVAEYLEFVDTNPLVYEIDESGLIDPTIKPKMTNVLTELSNRLSA